MIFHTVIFDFIDSVTDEDLDGLTHALTQDVARFADVTFYACGKNIEMYPGTSQYSIVAGAQTAEQLKHYLEDAGHKAIVADWKSLVASRRAVEFESSVN